MLYTHYFRLPFVDFKDTKEINQQSHSWLLVTPTPSLFLIRDEFFTGEATVLRVLRVESQLRERNRRPDTETYPAA